MMLELALITALAAVSVADTGDINGIVRAESTGEPIAGVRVIVDSGSTEVSSDPAGAYEIAGLVPGVHLLRFSGFGYHDFEVEVVVPSGGDLRLDVRLRPRPISMSRISVWVGPIESPSVARPSQGSREPGFGALRAGGLRSEPDVLGSLDVVPGVDLDEEFPTELHVRGGSADQNLVLLDGIPVYNPYHTGGVFSGINPDAVSRVRLHAGLTPARLGGRLSSVVEVELPRPGRAGFEVRGGMGLPDFRTTVDVALPGDAGLLLAGRSTTYNLVDRGEHDRHAATAFDEVLAKASFAAFGGEVALLALHGDNWLSSFADAEEIAGPGRTNPVRWTTDTDGVTWSRGSPGGGEVRARAWHSATRSMAAWGPVSDRARFDHGLQHDGISFEASRTASRRGYDLGVALERLSTSYDVRLGPASALEASRPAVEIGSAATFVSAFVDHRWIPHDRWMVDVGGRAVVGAGGGADVEPRLSLHARPGEDLSVSVGFARAYQYVQSLRNEESVLSAAFGLDALVSSSGERVPVGRSDQLAVEVRSRLAEGWHLEVESYVRWLDGLLLVAPSTPQPFAVGAFETGTGTARGIGALLSYRGAGTDVDIVGEWSAASRTAAGVRYRPMFERRRSLAAALAHRLGRGTAVLVRVRAVAGRPTSGLEEGFEYEPFDAVSGEVEFEGTPMRASDEVNGERLPTYASVDVGIRKGWRPGLLGQEGEIVSWFDVRNVLGRRNALALQESTAPSGVRLIPLSGTSLSLGLDWRF